MKSVRIVPLYPLVSTLAILSFKKKGGKGGDLGETSSEDLGLEGGNLSLSDLGGSIGSLSKLDKKDKKKGKEESMELGSLGGDLGGDLLAGLPTGGRADDKKIMELEASVNDLKKHAESTDMTGKATKNEIENIHKDLSQINDSIKSLLNVYEAVSRQYNPFVEDDKTGAPLEEDDPALENMSLGTLDALGKTPANSPEDGNGPLDRVLRPEDEEEDEDYSSLSGMDSIKISPDVLGKVDLKPAAPTPEPMDEPPARPKGRAPPMPSSAVDPYALEQVHKLVEYQLSKVYRARLIGEEVDRDEVEALERWMSEFRRLGGG